MSKLDGVSEIIGFLEKIQPKIAAQISKKIFSLAKDPFPNDYKLLKGYSNIYRVDSGEYRIVYEFDKDNDLINIILVDKRNDDEIYKNLKRRRG